MNAKPSSSVGKGGGRGGVGGVGDGEVCESGMHGEDVSPQGGAVAAAVGAVGAGVRALPCVGENVLLQVVFAGAAREHLATHAALRHPLLTTPALQSKHIYPQLFAQLCTAQHVPPQPAPHTPLQLRQHHCQC